MKCLCHNKSDRSSPVIEVSMSCQEGSVVTCYWSVCVMPGEWSVVTCYWSVYVMPGEWSVVTCYWSVYVMPRVIGRHLLLKCLCHAKSDRSSPVIEVSNSCQEWSVVTCYWSVYVMPGEWSVVTCYWSVYVMPRVIGRHLLLKCICHAKSDRSSPVIEVPMSCQESDRSCIDFSL